MMPRQLLLDLPQQAALSRADFLVTPGNLEAVRWVEAWPQWPAPGVIVTGEAGCGKTHLAHVWQARSQACVLPLTEALLQPGPEVIGDSRALVLDDIDTAPFDNEAFLYLYNCAVSEHVALLLLARQPVSHWGVQRADLLSRLRALPVVSIAAPDEDLLAAIMVKLFSDRQKQVDAEVIQYLLPRMERSFAAAHALVERLDAAALREHAAITVPFARRVLAEAA
jgi:chromosomal replication initiation ATPase DnaA